MSQSSKPKRAKILATGSYVPDKVLTNFDIEKIVDTTDKWITERTGIKERRMAAEGQASSDLACEAAKVALDRAGLKPRDLDMIVVATITADSPFPATACVLQQKLGAKKAFALDINAACSGFMYALSMAEKYIISGAARHVLIVGSETLTKFVDWDDRATCVLFGDGAGAAILGPSSDESGLISVDLYSDGTFADFLTIPGGGSIMPASEKSIADKMHFVKMRGNELFKVAVKSLAKVAVDTLKKNNMTHNDIALMVPHQANLRIITATAERLKLPMDKVFLNLHKYGNTSAASIPIAFDEAVSQGRVNKGDLILFEAFGAGLTWASALYRW